MHGRGNRVVYPAAALAAAAVVTVAGCTDTVSGSAQSAIPGGPADDRSYGYVDDRCGLLQDSTVAQTIVDAVGAENRRTGTGSVGVLLDRIAASASA